MSVNTAALWHPGVAVAVAGWLDQEADECCEPLSGALAVARAYLAPVLRDAQGDGQP